MTLPVSQEYLDGVRWRLDNAVWNYLCLALPIGLNDADIDQATDKFFEAGLASVRGWLVSRLGEDAAVEFATEAGRKRKEAK